MAEQFLVCANGHSNPAESPSCGVCGLRPEPVEGAFARPADPPERAARAQPNRAAPRGGRAEQVVVVPLSSRLVKASADFDTYATLFTVLTALGALAIGWATSQVTTCTSFSCTTETDGAAFVIGTAASFVGGMLLVLPLRGIATLLLGVADLVEANEFRDEE